MPKLRPPATPATPGPDLPVAEEPTRPGRARRVLSWVIAVLVAVPVGTAAALLLWDGGIDTGPRRELLPGVRLDLRTAQTPLGPVQYDLVGNDGPVVLSVHAGLGGADSGRLLADWLRGSGFRVLSPSRPGFPGTPLSSGTTLEEQADLLAALLDTLSIRRVGVLAVSAGAPVGYTFAARHPDRVWGLVSVSGQSRPPAGPPGEPSAVRRALLNTLGEKVIRLTAVVSLRTLLLGTLAETSTFDDRERAARADDVLADPDRRALFRALFDSTFPYRERWPGTDNDAVQVRTPIPLAAIRAPTLVVHGTRDGDVPFEDGRFAAEHIPGAQHSWLTGEEHLGFWLGPGAARSQAGVRDFLLAHADRHQELVIHGGEG